ncbi:hypothetical protein [Massilia sp. TN1-12]|uniref:hypothetical protein n=1 Tax=Massilia paldalensis TaxID=3377675 RepID=UPI00384D3770
MKKQIVQISLLQSAKVIAGMYFVLSLPMVVLGALSFLLAGQPLWTLAVLLAPLLLIAMGFVATLSGGWLYNLVAARVGGIEFTTAESRLATQ